MCKHYVARKLPVHEMIGSDHPIVTCLFSAGNYRLRRNLDDLRAPEEQTIVSPSA